MGEIERKIWKEMEENKELREILNENMKKTAERLAKISFFSETFKNFMRKVAEGKIKIY